MKTLVKYPYVSHNFNFEESAIELHFFNIFNFQNFVLLLQSISNFVEQTFVQNLPLNYFFKRRGSYNFKALVLKNIKNPC